jgi:hypothetical protein
MVYYLPACSGTFGRIEAYQIVCCVTLPRNKPRHMRSAWLRRQGVFRPEIITFYLIYNTRLINLICQSVISIYFNAMSAMPSYRGGYAPRGGRGGWNGSFSKSKKPFVKPDIKKNPLGQLLQTIKIADLKEGSITTLPGGSITDLRYIASYNWRSDTSAAILIPGRLFFDVFWC